jgi:glutamate racemase
MERGAAIVAVACNTSSALALQALRQRLSVPFVGMIDCGASAVARASASGRIGVMATVNTVRSRAYTEAIAGRRPGAGGVQQACRWSAAS